MAASAHFDLVQKIYIAFYQRPADPAGLLYWAEQIDLAGGSADSMIDNFGKSPEAISLFGAITAANIDAAIESIYQAAFSHPADAAGKAYWVGQFNAGVVSPTAIALAIVQGAQNADQTVITNKLTVANNFTAQIDGHAATDPAFGIGPFAVTYTATDAANARTILAVVTDSPATILTPEQITEQIRANIADPTDPISIQTFTLTTAAASVDEGQSMEFTVTASFAVTADTVLSYATSSTSAVAADFAGDTAGTVTILAGETTGTFSVAIAAENVAELAESFTVTLKDSTGAVVGTPKTIDINDAIVDLTAPVLTAASLVGTYAENSVAGKEVADLAADDVAATFAIASGNTDGYFAIDAATGKVTLTAVGAAAAAANDFETTPADSTFTLGVTATDAAGNVSDAANLVLTLTNVDDDAPVVTSAASSGTTVVLAFNEALSTTAGVPATSSFAGTQTVGGTVTNLNVTNVAINGSTVILTLGTAIPAGATVALNYTAPATAPLVDAAGNKVASLSAQAVTLDVTAPTLSSSTPTVNATAVAIGSNIELNFSETVKAGTGNIQIVNAANAADTRTISVTDATQVTFSGNKITINPTADLVAGVNYNVLVATTAVTDTIGNAYAGITNAATLNFTTPTGTVVTGSTFTLNQGLDNITGTANNDTINAFLDNAAVSFQGTDIINGGDGVDTLTILGLPTGATSVANVSNVEKFYVQTVAAGGTMNMGQTASETSVSSYNLTTGATLAFTNISGPTVGLGVVGGLANTTTTFGFAAGSLAGASDTATVTLNGALGTVDVDAAGNGIETVTLVGEGTNSTLAALTLGAAVTKVTLKGDKTINIGATDLNDLVAEIDASLNSAGVTVQQSGAATNQKFTGGSGNDTFNFGSGANLTAQDILNGGGGALDTLSLTVGSGAAATTTGVTNFERISLDAAVAQDMSAFASINRMAIGAAGGNTIAATFNNVANNAVLDILTSANTATVNFAANTGASDFLNVNLGSTTAALTLADLSVNAVVDNVLVTSLGTAPNAITAFGVTSGVALNNVTLLGGTALTLATTVNVTGAVDASAMTAGLTVTTTSTANQTISGSTVADNITTGDVAALATLTINGNAGNDTVAIGAAATATSAVVFNGGAGNDSITGTADAGVLVTFNGGAGIDTFTGGTSTNTIQTSAVSVADADIITNFTTATDNIQYRGILSNGTTTSGISAAIQTTAQTTVGADFSTELGANLNATVLIITTDLVGAAATALNTLGGSTAANLATNYAAFEAALVSNLGVIGSLDANLLATESMLLVLDNGASNDQVILRITNTSASGNTLTADEIELVGVFNNFATSALVADFT